VPAPPLFAGGYRISVVLSALNSAPSSLLKLLPPFTVMPVRFSQPAKAPRPMAVTLAGMLMPVRVSQFLKAKFPMVVTLAGMVMEVRFLQP
jgi:uncharacterized membrane protein